MSELVLHSEYLLRVPLRGKRMVADLDRRALEVKQQIETKPLDPKVGVSVLIRTKNDAKNMTQLMDDIRTNQEYFKGPVQVILVDTESADDTIAIARRHEPHVEVTVVTIKQSDFDYATSLNVGFEAAKYDAVFTLVGHSSLTTRLTLASAALYAGQLDTAGGFCYPMPNANASPTELFACGVGQPAAMLTKPKRVLAKPILGTLGANCSVVRRAVWQEMGGYDKAYGAGGEDGEFGIRALAAGYKIMLDPALTVHHSHGLNFINSVRQFMYWHKIAKPLPFDVKALARFRKEFR